MHRSTNFGLDSRRVAGDGVVCGHGTVDGRPVAIYSQDFTTFGGSLGEMHGQKITKVMDLALRTGMPLVGILDGGGARIQEGVAALTQFAEIFRRNVAASGVIPQISLILGPSAGGAVYSPALTDFIVMADGTSHMFITGPDVIRAVTGEDVGFEELGGGQTHNARSGVAHYLGRDEDDAIDYVRTLLGYLPSNNLADPPVWPEDVERPEALEISEEDLELDTLVPDSDNQPYDMRTVVEHVARPRRAPRGAAAVRRNVLIGFGHVEGHAVGIVANQPLHMAGTLDINAAEKAARFVRTCDAFGIPVLTFVDVPGFLPGTDQEWNGIIRRGAKLIFAYAEATVPLVTVITRKAYGGAYIVMGSKQLGADINLAWPTAQIAVMGAAGAVNILQRGALKASADAGGDVEAERARLWATTPRRWSTPTSPPQRGDVDAVIAPVAHADAGAPGAADAAHQARRTARQEAREHPAVTPDVRVVRGEPDDVELAALVAGLAAGASAGSAVAAVADLDEDATAARQRWRSAALGFDRPAGPQPRRVALEHALSPGLTSALGPRHAADEVGGSGL